MVDKVLVVTPYPSLGKLIQQSLEQSGAYRVQVTESANEALELCAQSPFSVAILDADVPDQTIVSLWQDLNLTYPDLPLVVIPPNNDPHSPLLAGLSPKAFLNKPFYLPDLLKTINNLISGEERPREPSPLEAGSLSPSLLTESDSVPWYEDPSQVLDRLTHISLGPGIHEAIITYTNEMWAYTGQLSVEAAQEISATTIHFWNSGENGDLARFIRLKTDGQQYFLYATHLSGSLVLTLIYDSNMPFSRIRFQTSQLARMLAGNGNSTPSEPPPGGSALKNQSSETETSSKLAAENQVTSKSRPTPEAGIGVLLPPEKVEDTPIRTGDSVPVPGLEAEAVKPEVKSENIDRPEKPDAQDNLNRENADIADHPGSGFEPVISGISNLTYIVVLIPRLPHHQLAGDLAARINLWMPQLCLAFGWKLEKILILPDHLEWTVRLPPDISPVKMLEIVCQHTSQRIFNRFPFLAEENPSGDFWAPGFLIGTGSDGFTSEKLNDYIARIRKQQTMAEY
jgi:CheY-like chemotaxis protein/REP element-mobilizing transposase RayT